MNSLPVNVPIIEVCKQRNKNIYFMVNWILKIVLEDEEGLSSFFDPFNFVTIFKIKC